MWGCILPLMSRCTIAGKCVLGAATEIGTEAKIINSYLEDGVTLGNHVTIKDSFIKYGLVETDVLYNY